MASRLHASRRRQNAMQKFQTGSPHSQLQGSGGSRIQDPAHSLKVGGSGIPPIQNQAIQLMMRRVTT